MPYCKKCGSEYEEGDSYCKGCGSDFTATPIKKKWSSWKKATVALLAIFFVLPGAFGVVLYSAMGNGATVEVTVYSLHVSESVDIRVYDGDELVGEYDNLGPGQGRIFTFRTTFNIFQDSKETTIKAISYGGGLGSITEKKTITVVNDGYYKMTLYV
jgi:hypothetical protein